MKKPFVISISGISGSGKSTVVNALKEKLENSSVVSFDAFGDDVYLARDINEWSADGNDENEWHVEPIAADIEKLLKEPLQYIIIDYPFGRKNACIGKFIDYTVFLDTPLDIALARRIIRDYTNRTPDRHEIKVDLSAIETELRHYLTTSRPTYERMPDTQIPSSDLVVDGTQKPSKIAEDILKGAKIL